MREEFQAFGKFVGARALTMVIELGGVWLFVEQMNMNDMLGKFITQFVVLVLNYIFSKFFRICQEENKAFALFFLCC